MCQIKVTCADQRGQTHAGRCLERLTTGPSQTCVCAASFSFFSPPNAVNRCSFHGNTHELHGYCSSEHIFWLAEGGMESRPCVCGWNAAGGGGIFDKRFNHMGAEPDTHTLRRLPFTGRHTDWLTCSLTHWVNRHVSHFKSPIFITTRSARTSNFHFSGERRLLGLCKHLAPVQMPPTNAASARPHKQIRLLSGRIGAVCWRSTLCLRSSLYPTLRDHRWLHYSRCCVFPQWLQAITTITSSFFNQHDRKFYALTQKHAGPARVLDVLWFQSIIIHNMIHFRQCDYPESLCFIVVQE